MSNKYGLSSLFAETLQDAAMARQLSRSSSNTQLCGPPRPVDQQLDSQCRQARPSHHEYVPLQTGYLLPDDAGIERQQMGEREFRQPQRQVLHYPPVQPHGNRYDELVAQERAESPQPQHSGRYAGTSRPGPRYSSAPVAQSASGSARIHQQGSTSDYHVPVRATSNTQRRPARIPRDSVSAVNVDALSSRSEPQPRPSRHRPGYGHNPTYRTEDTASKHSSACERMRPQRKTTKLRRQEDDVLRDATGWQSAENMDEPMSSCQIWDNSPHPAAPAEPELDGEVTAHTLRWLNSQASGVPAASVAEDVEAIPEPPSTTLRSWSPTAEAFLNEGSSASATQHSSALDAMEALPEPSSQVAPATESPSSPASFLSAQDEPGLSGLGQTTPDEAPEVASTETPAETSSAPEVVDRIKPKALVTSCEQCLSRRCGAVIPGDTHARSQRTTSTTDVSTALRLAAATNAVDVTKSDVSAVHPTEQEEDVVDPRNPEGRGSGWVMVSAADSYNNTEDFDLTEYPSPAEAAVYSSQETRSWWPLKTWLQRRRYRYA